MPRSIRVEYVGAMYHVMNRGNARGRIFKDERDYDYFKRWVGTVCEKAGWKVHAWTLMPNHYHLLIETRRKTLIQGMQLLNAQYTRYFNKRHRLSGPLFQGRYKATLVEGKAGYLLTVADYIHLNFVRANIAKTMDELVSHPETSVGCYVRGKFPEWMEWRKVMGSIGQEDLKVKNREVFYRHLGIKSKELMKEEKEWKKLRRSWCWGGEKLVERFERLMGKKRGKSQSEEIWQRGISSVTEERRAKDWLKDWKNKEQRDYQKIGLHEKWKLACELRDESCVPIQWLAKELKMKNEKTLRNGMSLYRASLKSGQKTS